MPDWWWAVAIYLTFGGIIAGVGAEHHMKKCAESRASHIILALIFTFFWLPWVLFRRNERGRNE